MSTEISTNVATGFKLPSYIEAAAENITDNMAVADSTPRLIISGKVWKVVVGGVKKPLLKKDEDGEDIPAPTVKVIILNQVPQRSRTYFEGSYVADANTAPTCHSVDGIKPDQSAADPQCSSCSSCEWAVKGSKITEDGKSVAACSTSKRICVVPAASPDFEALLLKLPVTSLWEEKGEEEAKGWFAYDEYIKYLKGNDVINTVMVETLMKFDSKVDHPKILFKYVGYPSEEVFKKLLVRGVSEEVMNVLGLNPSAPALGKPAKQTSEANVAPDTSEEDAEAEKAALEAKAEVKAKKEAAAKKRAATKAKKEAEDAEKAAAKEKEEAKSEPVTIIEEDAELTEALSNWD